ncbi:MAG: type II secretion system protein GspG [Synechococcaceae bacterium WB9_2_112]|jgi:general secretion pathway protein G|nr:type II secretion system protein GspG [Synechococcaceae bacterium WB9_2_112]
MKQISAHLRTPPSGFTLIEILVVVVIIGILAAFVVPSVMNKPDEARVVAAKQNLSGIVQALALYRLDNFAYPTAEQGLSALVAAPTVPPLAPNWKAGGYLQKLPQDPWGRPFVYKVSPDGLDVEIISLGADGKEGGSGFATDLSSKGI